MRGHEAGRQMAADRLPCALRGARGGPGIEAPECHRQGGEPIASGMNLSDARDLLEVACGGYDMEPAASQLGQHNPQAPPGAPWSATASWSSPIASCCRP